MSFFCFYPYLGGGWVFQTQIWIYPYFFLFFFIEHIPKSLICTYCIFPNMKLSQFSLWLNTWSSGGSWPTGKLIVFKLISSSIDDIFVNGPYLFPAWSVKVTLLMWCSSSSLTNTPHTVSTPSILSTTNWPCPENISSTQSKFIA